MSLPLAVLTQLPLLAALPQVTLAHLAQQASERSFAKREVVLQKDSQPAALCFLLDGRLQGVDFTLDGREVGLYFVNSGDYFGDVAVIDGYPQPDYVTAVSRSRVVFIPKELVRPILFAYPKVAEVLCNNLSLRLRQVSAQRRILGLANPLQRVCAQLQILMHSRDGAVLVPNTPTHQELAIMINASRETVSRVFQLLQGRGIVERQGNDLRVDNPGLLRELAAGQQLGLEPSTAIP
jgi:CRP/FNR family transcriptional regulator, cyclic AMP receptor protein